MSQSQATHFRGAITAIVTPFTPDGSAVDYRSLEAFIEYQLQEGIDGLTVCGSTGEAATLSDEEYRQVVIRAVEVVRGRVPIIVGIGTNATARAVATAQFLTTVLHTTHGDGIMVVAPPYNKPPPRGVIAHVEAVHAATPLPIIFYNVPGRTGLNVLPSTIEALARSGAAVAVKEASGSVDQIGEVIQRCGPSFSVLSGDDSLTLPVMALGAKGVISVASNVVPRLVRQVTAGALAGSWDAARRAHFELVPVVKALFSESNPIPVKAAAAMKGLIASDAVRLPLMPASAETRALLESVGACR